MHMRVGFLGLGIMGAPMAMNVLRGKHALRVWNRTLGKDEPLVEAGALRAHNPRDAARECDVVVLMLADPDAVEVVLTGKEGVLEGLERGTVVVDMSTVDPETT